MADFHLQGQLTDASSVARKDLARSVPGMAHFAGTGPPGPYAPLRALATSGTEPETRLPKVRRANAEGAGETGARHNTGLPVFRAERDR